MAGGAQQVAKLSGPQLNLSAAQPRVRVRVRGGQFACCENEEGPRGEPAMSDGFLSNSRRRFDFLTFQSAHTKLEQWRLDITGQPAVSQAKL